MKNFEFPQIFTPVVGEISFEYSASKLLAAYPAYSTRQMATLKDVPEHQQNQSQTSRIKTVNNLSVIADNMALISRKQLTTSKVITNLGQVPNSKAYKIKKGKKNNNAVKFNDRQNIVDVYSQHTTNRALNSSKKGLTSRRVMTQPSQNQLTSTTIGQAIKKSHEKLRKRTSIQDEGSSNTNNMVYQKRTIKTKRQKSVNKISSKYCGESQQKDDNGILIEDDVKQMKQCGNTMLLKQLERDSVQNENGNKIVENSSQMIQQQPHIPIEDEQEGESILDTIATCDLDKSLSENNASSSNFVIQRVQRRKSLEDNEKLKHKETANKLLLRRTKTLHTIELNKLDQQIKQESIIGKNNLSKKKRFGVKIIAEEPIVEGGQSSLSLLRQRKNKKVTFYSNSSQKQNLIAEQKSPIVIGRTDKKKKCIIKLRNQRTSIEMRNMNGNGEYEEYGRNIRKFATPFKEKRVIINKSNFNPGSGALLPIDSNIYHELNNFHQRIHKANDKVLEQYSPLQSKSQPMHMTITNKMEYGQKQRREATMKEHIMIDLGIRISRANKLQQRKVI